MHKNYINIAYYNYSVGEINSYRELVDMMVYLKQFRGLSEGGDCACFVYHYRFSD